MPAGRFSSLMVRSSWGAMESPSPAIMVVTPCCSLLCAVRGSTSRGRVVPPIMSMKPGARTIPCASMTRVEGRSERFPISTMRPSRMPTSARYQGFPEPSMTCAPEMTTSKVPDCPKPGAIAKKIKASSRNARRAMALPPRDLSDLDDRAQLVLSSAAVRKKSGHSVWPLSIMARKVQSLELEPDSYLALTTGQVLLNGAYSWLLTHRLKDVAVLGSQGVLVRRRVRAGGFKPIHRGCVIAIEEIEHFKEHLGLDALSEIESLSETHIHIDEGGRGLRI